MSKSRLTQQRVVIPANRNMAFFDDDDDDDDDTSSVGYSLTSSINTHATATDTFALAEFLSSTSPEEFAKPSAKKRQQRALRLLNKLRKRTTNNTTDSVSVKSTAPSSAARKHIPLPEYHPSPPPVRNSPSLRDSGVYSEISDKDYIPPPPPVPPLPVPLCLDQFPMPPPSIPAKSRARPRRPAPLPADVASAAINAALRSVPEAALRRRSVVRQKPAAAPSTCPHCRQHIQATKEERRLSCPPALATGCGKEQNSNTLRAMIAQLEQQLADERTSRQKLERVVSRQQVVTGKHDERGGWGDDGSRMQDRAGFWAE